MRLLLGRCDGALLHRVRPRTAWRRVARSFRCTRGRRDGSSPIGVTHTDRALEGRDQDVAFDIREPFKVLHVRRSSRDWPGRPLERHGLGGLDQTERNPAFSLMRPECETRPPTDSPVALAETAGSEPELAWVDCRHRQIQERAVAP